MFFNKKDIKKNKKKRSLKARIFMFFLNVFFAFMGFFAFWALILTLQIPFSSILDEKREPVVVFLDNHGNEIRASGRIMGTPVRVETLPPHVWQAIVAIEDRNFFEHGAISFRGTFRAVFVNLFHGRFAAGGSTITQQTAKNIFL